MVILLTTPQVTYISVSIIGGIIVIGLLFYLFFRNVYEAKHIRELTYRTLYRLSNKNDFLLLNNYRIQIDDRNTGFIDHILISKKFVILINDFSISGVVSGDYRSDELINVGKKTEIIVNPLNYNINLTKRLALFNDLDHSFLRGLVVINNDSKIDINNANEQFQIIRRKDLEKTIKKFDSANVGSLNEESIIKFVNYLNEQNNR